MPLFDRQKCLDRGGSDDMGGVLFCIVHIESAKDSGDLGTASRQFRADSDNVHLVRLLNTNGDLHAHITVVIAQRLEQHDRRVVQGILYGPTSRLCPTARRATR